MEDFQIFFREIYFLNHKASICRLSDTLSPSHSPRSDTSQKDLYGPQMGPVMFTADELYACRETLLREHPALHPKKLNRS